MDTVVVIANRFEEKMVKILEEFLYNYFWDELVRKLEQRDFYHSLTNGKRKKVRQMAISRTLFMFAKVLNKSACSLYVEVKLHQQSRWSPDRGNDN